MAGFAQHADGFLRRRRLGPSAARLPTDEEIATFALPAGTAPIILNVDRALTAAFQAAVAAMTALCLASPEPGDAPEHWAAVREAVGFAVKWVLIAAGPTPDPYRGRAIPEGQVFLTTGPGPGFIYGTPRTTASSTSHS